MWIRDKVEKFKNKMERGKGIKIGKRNLKRIIALCMCFITAFMGSSMFMSWNTEVVKAAGTYTQRAGEKDKTVGCSHNPSWCSGYGQILDADDNICGVHGDNAYVSTAKRYRWCGNPNTVGEWLEYTTDDGGTWTTVANSWSRINGKWYFSNRDGYLLENSWGFLVLHQGYDPAYTETMGWFYFNNKGQMQTGWNNIDGHWYYFQISTATDRVSADGEAAYKPEDFTSRGVTNSYPNLSNEGRSPKRPVYPTGVSYKVYRYVDGAYKDTQTISKELGTDVTCTASYKRTDDVPENTTARVNTNYSDNYSVTLKLLRSDANFLDVTTSGNGFEKINDYNSGVHELRVVFYYDSTSKLTANLNGGKYNNSTDNLSYDMQYYSTANNTIAVPTKDGYDFTGWYNGETLIYNTNGTAVNGQWFTNINNNGTYRYNQTSNKTVTANWTAKKFTLSYDYNKPITSSSMSGNTTTSQEVTYASSIGALPSPTLPGYTFNGWYTSKDGGNVWNSGTVYNVAGNTTLYAHWTPITYNVQFHSNVPTGDGNDMTGIKGINTADYTQTGFTYDASANLQKNQFILPGYTFTGWNCNGTTYSDGQSVSNLTAENNGTVHFYATWQKNPYTVTFDANGGTITSGDAQVTSNYGDTVKLSEHTCTIDDPQKEFVGWSLTSGENNASALVTNVRSGFSYRSMNQTDTVYLSEPGPITLYAVYSIPVSDVETVYFKSYNKNDFSKNVTEALMLTEDTVAKKYYQVTGNTRLVDLLGQIKSNPVKTDYNEYGGNAAGYSAQIIAKDHAGNADVIWQMPSSTGPVPPVPVDNYYTVRTDHYLYNARTGEYDFFVSTSTDSKVKEGTVYTPQYLTGASDPAIPAGYKADHVDSAAAVTGNMVFNAYYNPIEYKIHYVVDPAQGESCNVETQTVSQGALVGEMPTPVKEGHTFVNWSEIETGDVITPTTVFTYARDIYVKPSWSINSYTVTYDAATNGGSCAITSENVPYMTKLDINGKTHVASKPDFEFIGWNTDKNATTAGDGLGILLPGNKMPAKEVTLYAIYKRTVNYKFVYTEYNERTGVYTTKEDSHKVTYYNKETSAKITLNTINEVNGWKPVGWTTETGATASICGLSGGEYYINQDTVFYARYDKSVTISYITNSTAEIESDTGYAHYNASGNEQKYSTTLHGGLDKSGSSFVGYVLLDHECAKCGALTNEDVVSTPDDTHNGCDCYCFYEKQGFKNKRENGCTCCYQASSPFETDEDVTFAVRWDKYPFINGEDVYVTSDDVDDIESKILPHIKTNDYEDVTTPITIVNIDDIKHTVANLESDAQLTIIFRTEDKYGNVSYGTSNLFVTNVNASDPRTSDYTRFVSSKYAGASYENGGFEDASYWTSDSEYIQTLQNALTNADTVKDEKLPENGRYVTGEGTQITPEYVLNYTNDEIKEIKTYLSENGVGKYKTDKNTKTLQEFIDSYMR